ncbi:uncharacterized protein JCM6883_001622 [Sporobolomyces salmoneus]|uniref:uncharacterized protein n=1 Tax=Sporobolomyces salmoneus TaxID=183962 RepID=UPI00316D41E0
MNTSEAVNTTRGTEQQYLVVLAGVVGSGKSTLSSAWSKALPNWVRVNQDDLGDRRTCEQVLRSHLSQGRSAVLDRQNFDPGQRRTWMEIASEFPNVKVVGMVMGTSKEDCRSRLMVRENHPTIDNPRLALDLLDKFSGLWEEPRIDEGFDHLLTLPPLPPGPAIDAPLITTLIDLALAIPANPLASQQRQKKPPPPRSQYGVGAPPGGLYRRPDGFVDDGTWRPPPRSFAPPVAPNVGGQATWQPPPNQGYRPPVPPPASQAWGPPPVSNYRAPQPSMNQWSQGAPHVWGQGNRLGGPPAQNQQQQQYPPPQ